MNIPQINLKRQYDALKEEIEPAVSRVFEGGNFILGKEVKCFEEEMKAFIGVKYALGVGNGTDALTLALKAIGIGPGDEVITVPFTFFSTPEVICNLGARPVFVDIDRHSCNIDPGKIEEKITGRTKAILPVDLYGQSADMEEITKIAKRHNLFVIEDAAQAMGASYKGKRVGSISDIACASFFPTKNLGAAGDGGMLFTNNDELYNLLFSFRVHGASRKYHHERLGFNSRLDEVQAAILRVKLKRLDKWNKRRRYIGGLYTRAFSGFVETPYIKDGNVHIFHQYTIKTKKRDSLTQFLRENGIATAVHYPIPCHLQPALKWLGYKKGDFPVAEEIADAVLSLPVYPELRDDEVEYVIRAVRNFFEKKLDKE